MKTTEKRKPLEFTDVFNDIIIPIPNGKYFEDMDFGWYALLQLPYYHNILFRNMLNIVNIEMEFWMLPPVETTRSAIELQISWLKHKEEKIRMIQTMVICQFAESLESKANI